MTTTPPPEETVAATPDTTSVPRCGCFASDTTGSVISASSDAEACDELWGLPTDALARLVAPAERRPATSAAPNDGEDA